MSGGSARYTGFRTLRALGWTVAVPVALVCGVAVGMAGGFRWGLGGGAFVSLAGVAFAALGYSIPGIYDKYWMVIWAFASLPVTALIWVLTSTSKWPLTFALAAFFILLRGVGTGIMRHGASTDGPKSLFAYIVQSFVPGRP